jgi:hypothetical protein
VRRGDRGAEVVAAGIPNSRLGVPLPDFIAQMYAAGVRGSFDTLAIHPYSRSAAGVLALAEQARKIMDRNSDRARLWITELGWSTGGDASPFRVNAKGQADRIAKTLSALVAERRALRLRGFVLFQWKDSLPPPGLRGDPWPLHTGLLAHDGQPKPGFWTFARAVRELGRPSSSSASPDSAVVSPGNVRLSPLGFAGVTMGCRDDAPGACAGALRLRATGALRCGGIALDPGAEVGEARFRIAVSPALVPVRLTARARRLAQCVRRLRVRATPGQAIAAGGAPAAGVEIVISAR